MRFSKYGVNRAPNTPTFSASTSASFPGSIEVDQRDGIRSCQRVRQDHPIATELTVGFKHRRRLECTVDAGTHRQIASGRVKRRKCIGLVAEHGHAEGF